MDLKTFFENFDEIAQAPGGVKRLRELILDLAVRGKLAEQDPADKPSIENLKLIQATKNELLKLKVIRKSSVEKLELKDHFYPIPETWCWERLGNIIIDIEAGTSPQCEKRSRDSDLEWAVIKISAVSWGSFNPEENKVLPNTIEPRTEFQIKAGDFLMSRANTSQLVGRSVVVRQAPQRLLINDKTLRVIFPEQTEKHFFNLYNNCITARHYYVGQGSGTSNSMKNITRGQIRNLPVPVPPLAEQKRIVAKVEELMALCDEIEAAQQSRHSLQQKLRASALDALMNAPTDESLSSAWAFVSEHWDELCQRSEDVEGLRQTVLQMGIRGKLQTTFSSDEPTSELLNQLQEQRSQLTKEKKIPKPKKTEPILGNEPVYEMSEEWEWIRLGDISKMIEYGTSQKASLDSENIPVFRMNNIKDGNLVFDNFKYVPDSIKDLPRLYLHDGDILFNRTNSYELVGKSGVFRGESNKYTFASYLIRVSLMDNFVIPEFINSVINSTYFRQTQIEPEITQQCGQANFNGTKLRNTIIPLPPLAEQKRIVAKVEQLMTLCDDLQTHLQQRQQTAQALAQSLTQLSP